jgi:hypothetical protein|tara:strand:+ start:435 stop:572 length:138 start_codon:yes stop_codon:yes gene_type:complete
MKTNKMIRVLFLIKECRDKGKYDLALKIIDKYNIDKVKLEESYYD